MKLEQLRRALRDAEDVIAFFARAAVLRHCAEIAEQAGQRAEAARLVALAGEAERKVANVVQRALGKPKAPPGS